jgi:CheY-like chemotaxis protein
MMLGAHLTRQLLAYSGKGRFVIAPVDLSALVFEVTDLIRSTAPKKISIQLELAAGLPVISADRSQIHQVLMNLILNATEAIGRNAGSVTVRTGVLEAGSVRRRELGRLAPGRYAFLEVRDTGCGMDEATRARIFDPFFTTKFQGRGLGLAAVSGIVRAHQGSIAVDSTPGVGSTFTLYFPVTGEAALAPIAPRKTAFDGALRIDGAILVIDDEEPIRELVKSGLEHRNCTVLTAASGREAIATLKSRGADVRVAVLDLSMPGLGGDEVLPMLLEINPALKVIVSSGYSEVDVLRRFRGIPFDGFLQKPYTIQHLVETVQAVLIAGPRR